MKKYIPWFFLLLGLLIIGLGLTGPRYTPGYDIASFAKLPVQTGGRVMPLDSVAMNSLRIISGRATVRTDDERLSAIEWLLLAVFVPQEADTLPIFRIDNAEVLGMLGIRQEDQKYFAYRDLATQREVIGEQAMRANPEAQLRSVFERQVVKLANAMNTYEQLNWSFHPGGRMDQMPLLYETWEEISQPGREAFARREAGQSYNEEAFEHFIAFTNQFLRLSQAADLGLAPPIGPENQALNTWANIGEALLETISTGQLNPVAMGYAEVGAAYAEGDAERFNTALATLHQHLDAQAPMGRVAFEEFFNTFEPFYQSILLYLLIFLLVAAGWMRWPRELHQAALWLLVLAFIIHTFGLGARMYIQGRPPVTNLYSSAIFVGWAAVLLGIILERLYRNGVGAFTASIVGAISLVIAHNLAKTGDTLEMMRAVLDSNFWLATHVVIITAGYSAVFLAGTLAIYFVLRGVFTRGLDAETTRVLYRMVYGITCFGLFFSFLGTMLGGIWADQSWGRFWGWDPKENGALMIVLWGALMLHARWGGLVRERGFMQLAIAGNIITAWSWFGTNLLGVGLHSYGFTDSGFYWLLLFWLSQIVLMAFGALPLRYWGSRHALKAKPA